MRVGIDIDNVLALTHENIIKEVNGAPYNMDCTFEDWTAYDFWESFGVTQKDTFNMFDCIVEKGFFLKVPMLPACKYVMSRYKFEKFFITARRGDLEPQTKEWLGNMGIDFMDDQVLFVGRGTWIEKQLPRFKRKAFLADKLKLDCFIEDEGEVALEIAELGIPVILFNYPWNQHVHHQNIHRVGHWRDKPSYWRETENILRLLSKKQK